jgi:hypothetical protein
VRLLTNDGAASTPWMWGNGHPPRRSAELGRNARGIEITLLPERQRGPGGPRYRAVYSDDPNGFVGYGDTLREARLDLQKQSARSGMRDHPGDVQDRAASTGG